MKYLIRLRDDIYRNYENTSFLFPNSWEKIRSYGKAIWYFDGTKYIGVYWTECTICWGSLCQLIYFARMFMKYHYYKECHKIMEESLLYSVAHKEYKKTAILLKIIDYIPNDTFNRLIFTALRLHSRFIKLLITLDIYKKISEDDSDDVKNEDFYRSSADFRRAIDLSEYTDPKEFNREKRRLYERYLYWQN